MAEAALDAGLLFPPEPNYCQEYTVSDLCRTCGEPIRVTIYKGTGACGSKHYWVQSREGRGLPVPDGLRSKGSADLAPAEPVRSEPECTVIDLVEHVMPLDYPAEPGAADESPITVYPGVTADQQARWALQRAEAAEKRGDHAAYTRAVDEHRRWSSEAGQASSL